MNEVNLILNKELNNIGYNNFKQLMIDFLENKNDILFQKYFKDYDKEQLLFILEKNIMLSLENSNTSGKYSYWNVLKNMAPFVNSDKKAKTLRHYVDYYIVNLKTMKLNNKTKEVEEINQFYNKLILQNKRTIQISDNLNVTMEELEAAVYRLVNEKQEKKIFKINSIKKQVAKYSFIVASSIVLTTQLILPAHVKSSTSPDTSIVIDADTILNSNEKTNIIKDESNVNKVEKVALPEKSSAIKSKTNDSYDEVLDGFIQYDCPLDNNLQKYMFQVCNEFGVDYDLMMSIAHQESGGQFNTNGVISPTNDYGQMQINEINLDYIKENLGYTKDQILNDPRCNIRASAFLIKNIYQSIKNDKKDITPEEVFGRYNGWRNWKDIEDAVKYASSAEEIYETNYSKAR